MNVEELRAYCLGKKGADESLPFGPDALVFKVMDKMFALTPLEANPPSISLKCDPERAMELREAYPAIKPGYHMSKVHWNTLTMDGSVEPALVLELIDHSYDLVVSKLTKTQKSNLASL